MSLIGVFILRAIAIFALILGIQGTSLTDFYIVDFSFRALLIGSGILSLFKNKVGIVLLVLVMVLSIPDIEIGTFYWTPVRLFRLPTGFDVTGLAIPVRLGFDIFSFLLLSLLTLPVNERLHGRGS